MSDSPKINVSLKLDGAKPWVTVYGDSAEELAHHLDALAANGIGPKAAAALEQLKAGFEAGAYLGAEHVQSIPTAPPAQPAAAYQPPAPQPQAYQPPAQQYAPPAPAPAPAAPAPGAVAGPFLPGIGQNAVLRSGQSSRGPWSAWADPRPKAVTDTIPLGPDGKTPTTNDPNDPRLANMQAKFWQYVR